MKKIRFFVLALLLLLLSLVTFAEEKITYEYDLGDYKIVGVGENIVTPPHGASFTIPKSFGVVDKDGNFVAEPIYDEICTPVENRALFKKYVNDEYLYGYFDENWKEVIPAQFKGARNFSLGLAAVTNEDSKYGYIDYNGNLAIDYRFDYAHDFTNGCAIVEKRTVGYNFNTFYSYGIINHAGELLRPFIYDIPDVPYCVQISENTIKLNGCVYENDKLEYPFINYYGITYMPLSFYTCMHLGFTYTLSEDDVCITPPNSVPAVKGDEKGTFGNITGVSPFKKGEYFYADLYKGTLTIAGTTYTAQDIYYPLLVHENMVYVPVLWRQGMEAMGLDYTYDLESYSIIINSK